MTLITRFFQRASKLSAQNARIDVSQFKRTTYSLDWNLLIRMFDLRMWFIQQSRSNSRRMNMVHQLEQLHNDLNYLWMKRKPFLV